MNRLLWSVLFWIIFSEALAQENIEYEVNAMGNISSGKFAPYFIGSLNHGKIVEKNNALFDVSFQHILNIDERFSWSYGFEALVGTSSKNAYSYFKLSGSKVDNLEDMQGVWLKHDLGNPSLWLQQLYGQLKYRGVFFTLGMREYNSALLNQELSSGDLVYSGNCRPIPEIRIGFIDFQNIPFTNGWVQIQGEVSYGMMTENNYLKQHYNYYNYHIALNELYTYKRCYFRTKPEKPFSVTVGMQTAGLFSGTTYYYKKGVIERVQKHGHLLKTFWNMFFPTENNGEDFYEGSSLGSWDLHMRYRLHNGDNIIAYFQGPWEDGSSIGRKNKKDGLWGLEYKRNKRGIISGAVLEYLDFRDQSGPIHWNPADSPGTSITYQTTGRDDYYNNGYYNSYANFGMAIGTPFLLSPAYNLDGYPAFACNRANGFHFGIMGEMNLISYRFLFQHQRGLGTYVNPYYRPKLNNSMMVEVNWDASSILSGLAVSTKWAFDNGELRGDNFGALFCLSYNGDFTLGKR